MDAGIPRSRRGGFLVSLMFAFLLCLRGMKLILPTGHLRPVCRAPLVGSHSKAIRAHQPTSKRALTLTHTGERGSGRIHTDTGSGSVRYPATTEGVGEYIPLLQVSGGRYCMGVAEPVAVLHNSERDSEQLKFAESTRTAAHVILCLCGLFSLIGVSSLIGLSSLIGVSSLIGSSVSHREPSRAA